MLSEPNFELSVVIESHHSLVDIKIPDFSVTIVKASERLAHDIEGFLKGEAIDVF